MAPPSSSSAPHPKINKIFGRSRASHNTDPPPSAFGAIPETAVSTSNHSSKRLLRKPSKVQVAADKEKQKDYAGDFDDDDAVVAPLSETPIIVEPPPFPIHDAPQPIARSGRRSMTIERPHSMMNSGYDQSSPTTARLTDISSRLSGWFSQGFAGASTTDLLAIAPSSSTTTVVPPSSGQSPKHKASGIFNVARHPANKIGGGLEKAVRYLFDSDAQPDRCTDPIWIMGVQHPGYEPPSPSSNPGHSHRRDATDSSVLQSRRSTPPTISRGSTGYHKNPSLQSLSLTLVGPSSSSHPNGKVLSWPPAFYEDFTSCIWMTYRSQYIPIRDISLAALEATAEVDPSSNPQNVASPPKKWWGGEKTWTSDSGWGCMLRTGQSLLAAALVNLHLGRDWRRPLGATFTPEYATYVKLITWFLDSPSTLCPFGVHRMALAGKELGTEVGCWFGPSIAAGAIKKLAHAFPEAQLSVSVSPGGEVFESEIYASSHHNAPEPILPSSRRSKWGGRAVLVLIAHRLGIDGVNPVYFDGIKEIFTWPQSVGISGGRPSSSYYFVGQQKDSLFYLDPHHTRPAIPLRPPPQALTVPGSPATTSSSHLEDDDNQITSSSQGHTAAKRPAARYSSPDRECEPTSERQSLSQSIGGRMRNGSIKLKHRRNTGSQGSRAGSGSSNASFSLHAPLSPSPLSQNTQHSAPTTATTAPAGAPGTSPSGSSFSSVIPPGVDPMTYHYATAYPPSDLKTFHCDKVRKMPLSALDPSMLLGFLVKDEADWMDLRARVTGFSKTHKSIFTIQDEPPSWSDPEDLESFSDPEPEMDDLGGGADGDRASSEDFYDAHDNAHKPSQSLPASDAPAEWCQRYEREGSATTHDESFTGSDDFDDDDDDDFPKPPNFVPSSSAEQQQHPKRASTLTNSTKGSSKATTHRTDDSFNTLDDDDDWDSSLPSTSSPIAMTPPSKLDTLADVGQPVPVVVGPAASEPPHSRSSTSISSPPVGSTQYPFPRVPSPQDIPTPTEKTSTAKSSKNRQGGSGMRSLKGKDGGRTPSGGVLAIFNPAQED